MTGHWFNRRRTGFTLLEVLVALAIASILVGVVVMTLQTALDTYHFIETDLHVQKALDDSLRLIIDGSYETYGIKDALAIVRAGADTLTVVPPWIDDTHYIKAGIGGGAQEFILNRPFKAGSSLPIAEVRTSQGKKEVWQQVPVVFQLRDEHVPQDRLSFVNPQPAGRAVRFIYQADPEGHPDTTQRFFLEASRLARVFKNKKVLLPPNQIKSVKLQDLRFRYFDNTNTEIKPDPRSKQVDDQLLPAISAVKVELSASLLNAVKQGAAFVNLRNTRSSGSGLIIRKGTVLPLPNSKEVRTFSLINVSGVKAGGSIRLEAQSSTGRSWRIMITLDKRDGKERLEKYTVEYPAGKIVYSERINLTTDLPLNMLTLGHNGRYDYDTDPDVKNIVELDGKVTLKVVEMDAAGAAVIIRP